MRRLPILSDVARQAEGSLTTASRALDPATDHPVGGYARTMAHDGGAIVPPAPVSGRWPAELPDNRAGARMVTEHLVSLRHFRIAMISGPATLRTSREREFGYAQAMKTAGLEPSIVRADFTVGGAAQAVTRLLANGSPTAVFAATDTMALGVLSELRRLGIDVPTEVSVAGFDDIPGLEFMHPALTTVRVPMAELGA